MIRNKLIVLLAFALIVSVLDQTGRVTAKMAPISKSVPTYHELKSDVCQRKAKQERISKRVIFEQSRRQQGSDCGYYATYNGALMLARLAHKAEPEFLLPTWKNMITTLRKKANASLLDDAEVKCIAELIYATPTDYTIIPDVLFLAQHAALRPSSEELNRLRIKINRTNGAHAFILGTMNPTKPGTGGHWVSVVAAQNAYYILDSGNKQSASMIDMVKVLDQTLKLG